MDGKIKKRVEGYELYPHFTNCSIPSINNNDGRLLAVNDKFLVMSWVIPNQLNIVNSNNIRDLTYNNNWAFKFGNVNILDIEFSPFNSNIFAFSNDNNSVILTKIKEENDKIQLGIDKYNHGNSKKKTGFINFNPIASNIMCSYSTSKELHIWDSYQLNTISVFNIDDFPNSIKWSPNGDLIGISSKNGIFQAIDPRKEKLAFSSQISQIQSYSKFDWANNNLIATIGWNNRGTKYLQLLDIRKTNNSGVSAMAIDTNSLPTNPFVDPELKLIYSVAKEENYIRIFDYSQGNLQKNNEYKCSEENLFSVFLRRNYLDREKLELDRFVRLTKNRNIYYVGFTYKNLQNIDFDGNIYPNEEFNKPQLTTEQWLNGENIVNQNYYKRKTSGNTNKNQNNLKNNEQNKNYINNKNIYNSPAGKINNNINENEGTKKTNVQKPIQNKLLWVASVGC